MSIDEAKEELSRMKGHHYFTHGDTALDMAIKALEMQKKLAEFRAEWIFVIGLKTMILKKTTSRNMNMKQVLIIS